MGGGKECSTPEVFAIDGLQCYQLADLRLPVLRVVASHADRAVGKLSTYCRKIDSNPLLLDTQSGLGKPLLQKEQSYVADHQREPSHDSQTDREIGVRGGQKELQNHVTFFNKRLQDNSAISYRVIHGTQRELHSTLSGSGTH